MLVIYTHVFEQHEPPQKPASASGPAQGVVRPGIRSWHHSHHLKSGSGSDLEPRSGSEVGHRRIQRKVRPRPRRKASASTSGSASGVRAGVEDCVSGFPGRTAGGVTVVVVGDTLVPGSAGCVSVDRVAARRALGDAFAAAVGIVARGACGCVAEPSRRPMHTMQSVLPSLSPDSSAVLYRIKVLLHQ